MPQPTRSRRGDLSRRAFVRDGTLVLSAGPVAGRLLAEEGEGVQPAVRAGLVTDIHHADKAPAGTRYYRQSVDKLGEALEAFGKQKPDFVVELGDFIDAADSVEQELGYLKTIQKAFAAAGKHRHYVLGNHCVYTLHKEEFLAATGATQSHYAFDIGGFHFVVLDACFRSDFVPYGRQNFDWTDTHIPPDQLEWLEADLQKTPSPAILFVHQRLDLEPASPYAVKNSPAVRKVLEDSGKVLAVFQGHNHINDHKIIGAIHYCTLNAVIEGSGAEQNAYATMEVMRNGAIRITGFRKQSDYRLGVAEA